MPATGAALVGWRVHATYKNGAGKEGWYPGTIVTHEDGMYVIYFPEDDFHEQVLGLPDNEIIYFRPGSDAKVPVTAGMLPVSH